MAIKKTNTVKVKPIKVPLEYEIRNGNWTHVIVCKETNKAIGLYTSLDDAEHHISNDWNYNDLEIREYQP